MAFTPSSFTKLIFNQEYLRKFSKFLEKYGNYGWQFTAFTAPNRCRNLFFLGNSTMCAPVLKVMES